MSRENNVAVFRDTERLCKTNERLKASVKNATAGQKLILETDSVPEQDKERFAEPAKIVVSKKRSCEAARGYLGQKIAVRKEIMHENMGR